jgi:glycosyltransferase involved in cell wall biosynthesis
VLGEYRVDASDARTGDEVRAAIVRKFAERLATTTRLALAPGATRGLDPAGLTIVVCTRDRSELLDGCLRAVAACDPAPAEVIVVDNAPSDDRTKAVAQRHDVRYVLEPAAGLNRARNTGWRSAHTELVSYVDDDARPDRNFVAAAAGAFRDPAFAAVTGLVRPAELASPAQLAFECKEGGMGKGYERRIFHRRSAPIGLAPYRAGVGTNMTLRRCVLDVVGGFDERIGVGTPTRGGCDLDMFFRVVEAGHALVYEPDVVVWHIHRRSIAALLAQMRDYGTSFASLLHLYAREGRADERDVERALRRWHLGRHLRRPLGALRRGDHLALRLALAEARGGFEGRRALQAALAVRGAGA